jgi:hypothetical protein
LENIAELVAVVVEDITEVVAVGVQAVAEVGEGVV